MVDCIDRLRIEANVNENAMLRKCIRPLKINPLLQFSRCAHALISFRAWSKCLIQYLKNYDYYLRLWCYFSCWLKWYHNFCCHNNHSWQFEFNLQLSKLNRIECGQKKMRPKRNVEWNAFVLKWLQSTDTDSVICLIILLCVNCVTQFICMSFFIHIAFFFSLFLCSVVW